MLKTAILLVIANLPQFSSNSNDVTKALCEEFSAFYPGLCNSTSGQTYCHHLCASNRSDTAVQHLTCAEDRGKGRHRRIVGGRASNNGQFPWHVSLQYKGKHSCGASILSKRFLITAGHCVDEKFTSSNPNYYTIRAGSINLQDQNSNIQTILVKSIHTHPGYRAFRHNRKRFYFYVVKNDIAILELEDDLNFSHHYKTPICLPSENWHLEEQSECYIIGWGLTEFEGRSSDRLLYSRIPIVHTDVCNANNSFNSTVEPKQSICAGYANGTLSPCTKDSGGSLACKENGVWYVRGIISSGYKCGGPDAYSLYTNVVNFKDWLLETVILNARNGTEKKAVATASQSCSSKSLLSTAVMLVFYVYFTDNI